MGPTSISFLILFTVLGAAALVIVVVFWQRLGRGIVRRIAALVGTIVMVMVLAGTAVNRKFALYTTWGDLLGGSGQQSVAAPVHTGSLDATIAAATAGQVRSVVLPVTISGTNSGITLPGQVYVPAAMWIRRTRTRRFR